MSKFCSVCGEKIRFKVDIKDGFICYNCASYCSNHQMQTVNQIVQYKNENKSRELKFQKTVVLKGFLTDCIVIDENHKLLYFGKEEAKSHRYYSFDEISEYEFERIGEKTVTKSKGGLGRAIVGGALFGGVGAVVGATTSKRETKTVGGTDVLKIHLQTPAGDFIETLTNPPNGLVSFLDKCIDESTTQITDLNFSAADEILKYKSLLDQGVITQDEFEAKKKQLLKI